MQTPHLKYVQKKNVELRPNPTKSAVQQTLLVVLLFVFPAVLAACNVFSFFNHDYPLFLIATISICVLLWSTSYFLVQKYVNKDFYQLIIDEGDIKLFKNRKLIRHGCLSEVSLEERNWGSGYAQHSAIILEGDHFPALSIGTKQYSIDIDHEPLDYTDFLIVDSISWEDFMQYLLPEPQIQLA
ncbi:MAG: hypothetical protein AAF740_02160 [Bacteroidota bacterium]